MILMALLTAWLVSTQQGDPPVCIDPAVPFAELALRHDWPQPTSPRSEKAYALLQDYMRNPAADAYREALAEYRWLASFHRNDLHIKLALGVLYVAGPDLNFHGATGYRHNALAAASNAEDQAAKIMVELAASDPSQKLPAIALTRIALVSPERERMEQAVTATASLLGRDSADITARLLWHDLLIARERWQEAKEFSEAFPASCTALRHARAEALLLSGDTAAGARQYLATLDSAAPDELYRFEDDMRVMATQGQLAEYRAALPEERALWIKGLWYYSATSFARSIEARVAEHTVRAAYADVHFRATESGVATHRDVMWISDTTHLVPWDARGVLYVRHGPPLHRLRVADQCSEPYEAWVYTADDRPWIFWFARNCVSPGGLQPRLADWRYIEAPPLCGRPFLTRPVPTVESSRARLETDPERLDRRDIYTLLAQFDTRYDAILHECAKVPMGGATLALQRMMPILRREGHELFQRAQWTESSFPHIARPVRVAIGVYEFRGTDGRPELAALSWIPVRDLATGAATADAMNLSFVLTTPPLSAIRRDTTVRVADAAGGVLRGMAMLRGMETGSSTLRLIALDAGDSMRGGVRAVPVDVRGAAGQYGISDVVLAVPNSTGLLRRGAHAVAPLPGHRITVGDAFRLFVEVYGAEPGEEAETVVRITRVDNSALAQLRRLFPGREDARTLSFTRTVELDARRVMIEDVEVSGDLLPGDYRVEVTVNLRYGNHLVSSTALRVAESGAQEPRVTAKTLTESDRERLHGAVARVLQKGEQSSTELMNELRRTIQTARRPAPAGGA